MLKMQVIGNLTRAPEMRQVGGEDVCSFTVASSRKVDGKEYTTFVDVSAWGKRASPCARYLAKGRKVYVEGVPSARAYMNKEQTEARAALCLRASQIEFLSPVGDNGATGATDGDNVPGQPQNLPDGFNSIEDGELPF